MNKAFIVLFAIAGCLRAADLPPVVPVLDCDQLKIADLTGVADAPIHITSAEKMETGKPAPYCKVTGFVEPQVKFEVRLPLTAWTQRYLQVGCGGLCGHLSIHVENDHGCKAAEGGEFALASTDMGHEGNNPDWGDDPKLRIDFAYRGVHVTALAAKALIKRYYGQPARYSYFAGCSDGGREALMEAQRFPDDFDGVTAGAPAMNFTTQNTFYHGWNARVNTDAQGHAILTADKLPILHAAAMAACHANPVIQDPRTCHFDPAVTQCKPGEDTAHCLTAEQVEAARNIYQGAHDSKGQQLVMSGPEVGSELAWKGVYIPEGPDGRTISPTISQDTIKHLIYAHNPPPSFTLADFHFDQATFNAINPMHALYDATNPDLRQFADHHGKLILWHGWEDPHISPLNTIAYYSAVQSYMGAKTKSFVRLYLFPGMYHCGGGEQPSAVDLLTPIMQWVESGKAPEALMVNGSPEVLPYSANPKTDQPNWLGADYFKPVPQ